MPNGYLVLQGRVSLEVALRETLNACSAVISQPCGPELQLTYEATAILDGDFCLTITAALTLN